MANHGTYDTSINDDDLPDGHYMKSSQRHKHCVECQRPIPQDEERCGLHRGPEPEGGWCEHESIVTYTARDWRETGIAPGTICEDCGAEFDPEELDDRSFYRDEETGKVTW